MLLVFKALSDDFGRLIGILLVLHVPVSLKIEQVIWVHITQVFNFHVILDRMVDAEEDPRGNGQWRHALVHDDADGVFGECLLSRQKAWGFPKRIRDCVLFGSDTRFLRALVAIGEDRASNSQPGLS